VAVAAALVLALVGSACASTDSAAGDFTSVHRGVLTVATAEIPLPGLWTGTPHHPTGGFEYQLARDLAHKLGLGKVKVVIVPFTDIVTGHLEGADLALSDITATNARSQYLDFTDPYLAATPAVLVRAGRSVPDLKTAQGLSWAVGRSTTLADFLHDTVQPDHDPSISDSQAQTVAAVREGRVEAGLLDLPVAAAVARDSHGELAVAGQFDQSDDLSVALPNNSPNLDAVSSAVRALIADGTVASLAEQWLGLRLDGTTAEQIPVIPTQD
jgi:polar amino acid transport system substrate-binding protein